MKPSAAERAEVAAAFSPGVRRTAKEWDGLLWFYSRPLWLQRLMRFFAAFVMHSRH